MGRRVRTACRRRRGRGGKSWRPDERGHDLPLNRPPLEGDDASAAIEQSRKRTTARRDLERNPRFEEVSPEVGELDEAAVEAGLDDDPDEMLSLLADLTGATDPKLRELARRLAGRLFLDVARRGPIRHRGVGQLVTAPYAPDAGDLDFDASFEEISDAAAAGRALEPDRLKVRRWVQPDTALCLLVDRSGSMGGRPLATAAAAAAAVAFRAPKDYSVVSFAKQAVVVRSQDVPVPTDAVVDGVLALRGFGTTDLAAALQVAAEQLARSGARRRITVLLSDCRANEPGDAAAAAARLDELVVLAPAGDDEDAREFAASVGAAVSAVSGPSDVADALTDVLDQS